MTSPSQRLSAVEARLAEIEGGYGQTLYRLERRTVGLEIGLDRILRSMGLVVPSDEEIDARLDEQ